VRRLVLLIVLLAAPFPVPAAPVAPVPVGAIEILTGPNAAYGTAIRDGLELALQTINRDRPRIDLHLEDSAGTKQQAISAARKLIGRDHVSAIIGPTLSTEMFAVGPVANQRGVPIIGTSTTAAGITAIGPFVFRTALPESQVIPVTFARAARRGVKTIALLYANDDAFSTSGFHAMEAAARAAGFAIVAEESFASRDADFSAQLTRIKSLHPDAVAISALVEPLSGVLLQARQVGFGPETLFIGGNGANSPKLGQIAGRAADGLIVGSPWSAAKPDPANVAFVAAFRAKTGHLPDQFAAQAYDTMFILAEAIERAGGGAPGKLRDALLATDHHGVMGPFRFDAERSPAVTEGVVVLQMQDGQFRLLPPG
jgi:branched-chain amino acid transport system substrate-binding protein